MDLAFECNLCSNLKGPQSISTLYVFLHCVRCCFYLRLFSSQKGAKDRISSSNLISTLSKNALLLLLFEMLNVDVRKFIYPYFSGLFLDFVAWRTAQTHQYNTTQHQNLISTDEQKQNKHKWNLQGNFERMETCSPCVLIFFWILYFRHQSKCCLLYVLLLSQHYNPMSTHLRSMTLFLFSWYIFISIDCKNMYIRTLNMNFSFIWKHSRSLHYLLHKINPSTIFLHVKNHTILITNQKIPFSHTFFSDCRLMFNA